MTAPAKISDEAFDAWRNSLPATHWSKYDLSACRLGWDAAIAVFLSRTESGEAVREVAWLIERKWPDKSPSWYFEDALDPNWHEWSPTAALAKRFATKAEAETYPAYQMIAGDPNISITEHVFIGSVPSLKAAIEGITEHRYIDGKDFAKTGPVAAHPPSLHSGEGERKPKPLQWSESRVFGSMKRRAFGLFGEFDAFTVDGMTAETIAAKEEETQARYDAAVLATLEPQALPGEGEPATGMSDNTDDWMNPKPINWSTERASNTMLKVDQSVMREAASLIKTLTQAVETANCPRPANGRPDEETARSCVDSGNWGPCTICAPLVTDEHRRARSPTPSSTEPPA